MVRLLLPLLLLLLSFSSIGQTKGFEEYRFTSNFQVDKTLSGNLKRDNRKVSIYFKDPKPITKVSDDAKFEDLPTGKLIIKYENIKEPIEIEIKYFGKYDFGETKNQSLYGITKTWLDYNSFIFVNKPTLIAGKMWNNALLIGNMNADNGNISVYTVYCCI
jgi:hypothetical protein